MRFGMKAVFAIAVAAATVASAAYAGPGIDGSLSGPLLTITAVAAGKTAQWQLGWDQFPGLVNGKGAWRAPGLIELRSNGDLIASLDSLNVFYDVDPAVQLNFSVTAGNTVTTFTFTSSTVVFTPLVNPIATATAAVTVTDNTGNGATLTGLLPGGKVYRADTDLGNYAFLVNGVSAGMFQSNTATENLGGTIAGTVSSISSQFSFTLTPFDGASGTSSFTVIPEPGSLLALGSALAGFAGLVLRRKA
ncbi:MAG: PEP-CTERM sorting domain-containing protein [Armatimonadota bacterium]|jgi:hypothetical protein